MDACTFPDAEGAFDALVSSSAAHLGVDPVCSTTRWIVPAAAAFAPQARRHVYAGSSGMVALLQHDHPNGPVFTSFDCIWGFATPIIGPDPDDVVAETFDGLLRQLDFYAVSISGVDPNGRLITPLEARNPVGVTASAERCVARLDGDFDGWLARRSSRFRRSLRAAVNRATAAGVTVESLAPSGGAEINAAIDRVLDVERRSWKTSRSSGLIGTDLGYFTRAMSHRFARTGDLRVQFARRRGRDIGYVLGGSVGDRYRGFQHSFDDEHADLSIGKVLQFHNIEARCAEGIARYDMGMHMPYKESYTDEIQSSITLIFAKR